MDTNDQPQNSGIDFDQELDRIGYSPDFPPSTINGVKLSDTQHQSYIALAGTTAKSLLSSMMNSNGWSQIPDKEKLDVIRSVVQKARANAQSIIMAQSLHRPDGIMQQSLKKQMQAIGQP